MASDYYDGADLQALTGIPRGTWRYWRSIGKGPPSFKVGRKRLYSKAAVHKWLAELEKAGGR